MLHLVGLGLADETDITVRGLEIVKRAERVYLEAYTSILLVDKTKLVGGLSLRMDIMALAMCSSLICCYSVGSVLWPPRHRGGSRISRERQRRDPRRRR